MAVRFDETPRGRKFFEGQLPQLIKAIEENTAELKRANDLKEAEHKAMYGYGLIEEGEPDGSQEEG